MARKHNLLETLKTVRSLLKVRTIMIFQLPNKIESFRYIHDILTTISSAKIWCKTCTENYVFFIVMLYKSGQWSLSFSTFLSQWSWKWTLLVNMPFCQNYEVELTVLNLSFSYRKFCDRHPWGKDQNLVFCAKHSLFLVSKGMIIFSGDTRQKWNFPEGWGGGSTLWADFGKSKGDGGS